MQALKPGNVCFRWTRRGISRFLESPSAARTDSCSGKVASLVGSTRCEAFKWQERLPLFRACNCWPQKCPQGLNRSQLQKSKLWRLCLQNLSNGCSTHTGTILKWDGSRFYRRNQAKKSARPTLYTRALNGHFLEFAAENIHRTCRLINDIEKSAPKRRIAARQMATPIRLRQRVRNVGREETPPHFPFFNSILITAHPVHRIQLEEKAVNLLEKEAASALRRRFQSVGEVFNSLPNFYPH